MGIITIIAALGIILLSLVWFIITILDRRQLNKLRRNYNEEEDKSRPSPNGRGIPGSGRQSGYKASGESELSGVRDLHDEHKGTVGDTKGIQLLPNIIPGEDERKPKKDWPKFE